MRLAWLLLSPSVAACPVCFGKSLDNAGFARGITFGIIGLLLCTFAVLAVLFAAVIRIEKARLASEAKS